MKTPSDDLFTLVKSLDTREKIFFKIYSAKKGSNTDSLSYLKLFDIIDKLKHFDESLLKAKLEKTGFKHHLNQAKNYLANAILNSLREYHSDISVNAQLQHLLHEAEVLIKKKLIVLAKKILLKAEKLALKYELYDYLMVISALKESVIYSTRNIKEIEDYLNHGAIHEEKYLERFKNMIAFRNLAMQMQLLATISFKAKERDINKINSMLNSPLLSSPDKALSFISLKNYYVIHFLCSQLLDKWDHATYQRQKEWVTYLESDKTKLPERTDTYFSALINLMLIQIQIDSINEAEKIYEKIKHFYFSLPLKKRTKAHLANLVMATCNYIGAEAKRGNLEKALKTWEQIQFSVFINKLNPNILLVLWHNLSCIYFTLGHYHEALQWINKILVFKENNYLETQAMNRIQLLLVHYELGNYKTLPYIAKSSQRFLEKHNYFSEFEKIIISFFKKKIHMVNDEKQINLFTNLKKQLDTLLKNTKQIRALEYFDYMSWIESKIEKRPFVEIVREKAKMLN